MEYEREICKYECIYECCDKLCFMQIALEDIQQLKPQK